MKLRTICLMWILLTGALLAVYFPALDGQPIWDDNQHLTRPELSDIGGLARMWTEPGLMQQYYPVTDTAFWLQYQVWGTWTFRDGSANTIGYHVVNIALHAFVALMIGVLLAHMRVPGAWIAALVFAFHPVHVESVAWMSELKNVLSASLYLLAMACYLWFHPAQPPPLVLATPHPGARPTTTSGGVTTTVNAPAAPGEDVTGSFVLYILAFVFFAAALLSKSVTASLPAAILLVTWWRRGKLGITRDILPMVPFFTVAGIMAFYTVWHETTHVIATRAEDFNYSIAERFLIAGRVLWFYVSKLVWPVDLAFVYPRWVIDTGDWRQWLFPAAAGLLVLFFLALTLAKKIGRGPLTALLYFGGTLFPALGFINVFPFVYSFVADHFQYLASIGIIGFFACGFGALLRRTQGCLVMAGYVVVACVVIALATLSFNQSKMYESPETLWQTTLDNNPDAYMAYINLGALLEEKGSLLRDKPEEAAAYFTRAEQILNRGREIKPTEPDAYTNLSLIYSRMGKHYEALSAADTAIANLPRNSKDVKPYLNKVIALSALGRLSEAIEVCNTALDANKDNFMVYNNLGVLYAQTNRIEESIVAFKRTLELSPDYYSGILNMALAYEVKADFQKALEYYEQAQKQQPDDTDLLMSMGNAHGMLGERDKAIALWNRVISLKPGTTIASSAEDNITKIKAMYPDDAPAPAPLQK